MSSMLEKKILSQIPKKITPLKIFDKEVIDFLNNVSYELFKIKDDLKKFPDLISFAFWCRKNNVIKISKNYTKSGYRLGRGRLLHITPSNVPVNFAFSLAFGLLSGNYNIVRIPSNNFEQSKYLIRSIKKLLDKKKYKNLRPFIKFIQYKRDDNLSKKLSLKVEGRVIWGGDQTIEKFKSFKTQPKCIDISFPDRNSCSIINLKKVMKLKSGKMDDFIKKFYLDSYTMDQNACSSPKLVFLITERNLSKKFWSKFQKLILERYKFDLSISNQKLLNLTKNIETLSKKNKLFYDQFSLLKIKITKNNKLENFNNLNSGFFFERKIKSIEEIAKYIDEKTQTVTYFGVSKKEILKLIQKYGILGVDRIVPVGQAFEIGPIWDGHDLILKLSRIIQ